MHNEIAGETQFDDKNAKNAGIILASPEMYAPELIDYARAVMALRAFYEMSPCSGAIQ